MLGCRCPSPFYGAGACPHSIRAPRRWTARRGPRAATRRRSGSTTLVCGSSRCSARSLLRLPCWFGPTDTSGLRDALTTWFGPPNHGW